MGDTRFDAARERFEEAQRGGSLGELSPETGLQALAAYAAERDPLAANVLATRLLNQFRRSATLLRFVDEGVVALDDEGRILFANPAADRLLGWEEGSLVGRDFHQTVHHQKMGEAVPRHECTLLGAMKETIETVHVNDHDVFVRKDGTSFMAGFVSAPILHEGEATGVAVTFRDIGEAKRREAELALQAAALDAVPAPIMWLARDASVLYANAAAAEHLGYSRDELTRMRVPDFDPEFPQARWDAQWREVKASGVMRVDSTHRTRDGALVPVRIRVQHVAHDERGFHIAVVERRDGAG